MDLNGGLIKKQLWHNNAGEMENAFFTENMLDDGLAVREHSFYGDGEAKTSLSLRYCNGDLALDYELYWGQMLYPIQCYRMAKDIADHHDKYMLDDFFDVVNRDFCRVSYSNKDTNYSPDVRNNMTNEVQNFFKKIRQLKE